jgi:hypothetical protein
LDLSGCGGFVTCPGDFDFGEQVQLRIEDMGDPFPSLASLCRRKDKANVRRIPALEQKSRRVAPPAP